MQLTTFWTLFFAYVEEGQLSFDDLNLEDFSNPIQMNSWRKKV